MIETVIVVVLHRCSWGSFECEDAPLQLRESVSDLTVGPGQGRDGVLHLSHSRGQLFSWLNTPIGQTRLHTETPSPGGGGDLGPRGRPGEGVRHPPGGGGGRPDGGRDGQGGGHLGIIQDEGSTSPGALTPVLINNKWPENVISKH